MPPAMKTSVLVVGGGPVGVTVALDLHRRGVPVTVVEQRVATDPWSARCNHVAARSMEIFRQLGVADKVRACGLPDDFPTDVAWMTRMNDFEVARVPLASRAGRFADRTAGDAHWSTPEPAHRCSQLFFDPVLQAECRAAGVPFLEGAQFVTHREDAGGVVATIRPIDGAPDFECRCDYMVGCDGAHSTVRKLIGARLVGKDNLFRCRSILMRAPWMRGHIKMGPAWMSSFLGPGPLGVLMALDGRELWLTHVFTQPEHADSMPDLEQSVRAMLNLPPELEWETIHVQHWTGRRMIADKFREGRVFICGDAAHVWPPFAGFGMNCGIADGANLSWLLGAVLHGWGDPRILDVYETERQPVTDQVSRLAMDKVTRYLDAHKDVLKANDLDRKDRQGADARAAAAAQLLEVHAQQYLAAGLNFGCFYDNSPIIAYDGEAAPEYTMGSYTPSTVPGCLLPHVWLPDGRSIFDLLGTGHTLLRFDRSVEVSALTGAAKRQGVPMQVLDLFNRHTLLYRHRLILVRPDQYIAWRGDEPPADAEALISLLRGAGRRGAASD